MNRRELLKVGLAGIGAGLALDAEAAEGETVPAAITRLRRRLTRTETLDLDFLSVPPNAPPEALERASIDATLIRSSMRALLVTGAVLDLGEEGRAHPDTQRLVAELGPELDHAVEGSFLRLAALPDADRRRVQAALRERPEVAEEVAIELEHLAGKGGASTARRLHLRSLLQQVTWRLTHQPLALVLGEAVEKTRAQEALFVGAPGPTREGPWAEATERIRRAFVTDADAAESPELPQYQEPLESRGDRLRQRASVYAFIGAGLLVGGAVFLGLGVALSNPVLIIGSLFVFTAVIVMLIIALITAIIAAQAAQDELYGAVPG
ncbi:MAG: hypothetical protein Q8P41_15915 [Pseudomonadota bacterium]|nr:hypothetical protein [Pseudomonadota bacterium]